NRPRDLDPCSSLDHFMKSGPRRGKLEPAQSLDAEYSRLDGSILQPGNKLRFQLSQPIGWPYFRPESGGNAQSPSAIVEKFEQAILFHGKHQPALLGSKVDAIVAIERLAPAVAEMDYRFSLQLSRVDSVNLKFRD